MGSRFDMLSAHHHAGPTSLKDRTAEFHQRVTALSANSSTMSPRERLLQSGTSSLGSSAGPSRSGTPGINGAAGKAPAGAATIPKGEFARRAQAIGKDITDTTAKLGRLAQLARRKTLFDDRPAEISELTYIIKHDIAAINKQLSDLQAFNKSQRGGKATEKADEHRGNVVTLLQTKLAGATTNFQDILEVRTQNMKASKDRTEQFAYSGAPPPGPIGPNNVLRARNAAATAPGVSPSRPDSPLYNPTRTGSAMAAHRNVPQGANAAALDDNNGKDKGQEFLALDMGSGPQTDQYMQMQMMENGGQNTYMQHRSTAIESIESTISELGQIFGQLASMVAEQRETVQRIDSDVFDVADNVSGAQRELLKYYASVSSNRWLMLKIFGVLIVFFLVFILVS